MQNKINDVFNISSTKVQKIHHHWFLCRQNIKKINRFVQTEFSVKIEDESISRVSKSFILLFGAKPWLWQNMKIKTPKININIFYQNNLDHISNEKRLNFPCFFSQTYMTPDEDEQFQF